MRAINAGARHRQDFRGIHAPESCCIGSHSLVGNAGWGRRYGGRFPDHHAITGVHGAGPTLLGKLDLNGIRAVTTTGRNNMATVRDAYDTNQIRDVSEFITTVLSKEAAGATKP